MIPAGLRHHPDVLSEDVTRVVLAVLGGARTVREVHKSTRFKSISDTYARMAEAKKLGLIAWEPKKQGTLRPTVTLKEVDNGRQI